MSYSTVREARAVLKHISRKPFTKIGRICQKAFINGFVEACRIEGSGFGSTFNEPGARKFARRSFEASRRVSIKLAKEKIQQGGAK